MKFLFLFVSFIVTVVSSEEINQRIVNGQEASIEDFPHALSLLDLGRYICGASVISRYFALSAAHCLARGAPPSTYTLTGGSTNRLVGIVTFHVINYSNHPNYRTIRLSTGQTIWDYDVSVIEINGNPSFEGHLNVRPTILPNPCSSECCGVCEGTVITIAGWGRTHLGTIPVTLQKLNQTIVNHERCGSYWENEITDRMFCVTATFYDSCDGDSGSGILATDRINQLGYVSFGSIVCGDGSAPAVYGRLEHIEIRNFVRQISGV